MSTDNSQTKTLLTQKQITILTTIIHWPTDICYPGDLVKCLFVYDQFRKLLVLVHVLYIASGPFEAKK